MKRKIFGREHELFREQFGRFLDREIVPHYEEWERRRAVPREAWKKAGENGFLCTWLPEEYGGADADFLYSAVMLEEIALRGVSGFGAWIHSDIIAPYLWYFGTDEQKKRWLPGCATGDKITAVAMTEPDAGSDLQAIRTSAVKDGGHYIINGQKTFISNGYMNDLVIVAAKTDPAARPAYKGVSLFVVEAGTEGYEKGRRLAKIGWHAQDTAELSFNDCRVPAEWRLGEEGQGFKILMKELQQERLVCSIISMGGIWRALALAREYIGQRKAFGRPLSKFQNTRFKMAEMLSEAEIGQAFLDRLIEEHVAGARIDVETSMAKYWSSETHKRVADECLQFFGGYGYMEEYPIAREYRDSRVQTLFAGTSEIMKEIIAKNLLPG